MSAAGRSLSVDEVSVLVPDEYVAVPAGVLAQAWCGGRRQARIARLLRASNTSVVPLDAKMALRVGARCAATRAADIVDVSVAICASDRGHPVITSDPDDIAAIDPALMLVRPT